MKAFQLFFAFAIACLFTTNSFANISDFGPTDKLRKEVALMVSDAKLSENGITTADVWINFTLNEKNQIVILDVDSESNYLESFVKERLESQEIRINSLVQNKEYNIKISFASQK